MRAEEYNAHEIAKGRLTAQHMLDIMLAVVAGCQAKYGEREDDESVCKLHGCLSDSTVGAGW